MSGFSDETVCPKECAPGVGCVECVPGNHQCDGQVSQVCDGDGNVDEQDCDPLQGLSCDVNSGLCIGACAGLGSLT